MVDCKERIIGILDVSLVDGKTTTFLSYDSIANRGFRVCGDRDVMIGSI